MTRRITTWILAIALLPSTAIAGEKGLFGALIGAGAGAAIGHSIDRGGGSGKGAVIGALGGYFIGNQMDKSKQETDRQQNHQQNAVSDCKNVQYELDHANQTTDKDKKVFLLQNTVRKCPQSARIHNDLGVAYHERNHANDKTRARLELEEALRIDPGYTAAKRNLDYL